MAQLVKVMAGLAIASVKTSHGLAIASVKTVAGLDNTSGGGPTGGPFGFVKSLGATADAGATTIAVQLLTVTAGNLIALWVKHESTPTTISVSDGTTAFTGATKRDHTNADLSGQWFYLLSSVASGTVTYTATFGASKGFRRAIVFEYTRTGVAAFDSEAISAAGANGTTMTSGNLTTVANDSLVLAGYGDFSGGSVTTAQINAVAFANAREADGGTAEAFNTTTVWARTPTATFTGPATAALPGGGDYILNAIAFK